MEIHYDNKVKIRKYKIHAINDYMTRCFADGTCQLTEENYEEL